MPPRIGSLSEYEPILKIFAIYVKFSAVQSITVTTSNHKQQEFSMNYRSRVFYLGLNLLAPGIGQIALKWYIRGILELLIFMIAFAWGFMELLLPLFQYYTSDLPVELHINIVPLLIAVGTGILVFLWSLVEIILFYNPPAGQDKDKGGDAQVNK